MIEHEGHAAANEEQVRLLREALAQTATPALREEAVPLDALPRGTEPDSPGLE
ncbi:hypothetical protein [Deinococcus planocerae]|uniref:hypothetical protein n=1 Tax=Deinococcus planocerae TaxID=1737569 RepID=UPI0015E06CEE|nr:hypothetical protein [Deinococcus planocerae]